MCVRQSVGMGGRIVYFNRVRGEMRELEKSCRKFSGVFKLNRMFIKQLGVGDVRNEEGLFDIKQYNEFGEMKVFIQIWDIKCICWKERVVRNEVGDYRFLWCLNFGICFSIIFCFFTLFFQFFFFVFNNGLDVFFILVVEVDEIFFYNIVY